MSTNADISDDLLFPVPESLSPRLAWIKKHGIITYRHSTGHAPATWFAGFQEWWPNKSGFDFFFEETANNGDSRVGEGDTEDDALANLLTCGDARAAGIRLWNEEGAA